MQCFVVVNKKVTPISYKVVDNHRIEIVSIFNKFIRCPLYIVLLQFSFWIRI